MADGNPPLSLHRYVDASEIAKLCASAGTPMSHADLEAAMAELDTDGSGRVEKVCVCYVVAVTQDSSMHALTFSCVSACIG